MKSFLIVSMTMLFSVSSFAYTFTYGCVGSSATYSTDTPPPYGEGSGYRNFFKNCAQGVYEICLAPPEDGGGSGQGGKPSLGNAQCASRNILSLNGLVSGGRKVIEKKELLQKKGRVR